MERIIRLRELWRQIRSAWTTDHSLTVLLAMLVVLLFIVTPLVSSATIDSELGIAFFSLLAMTGVGAVARRPGLVSLVATCAVASIVLDWVAHFSTNEQIQVIDVGLRAGFVVLLAALVTAQVFRPGDITHHRVQGAIVVYLLAGLAWGYVYEITAIINSSAFNVLAHNGPAFARPGLFRYYSFETLTTLGYGDILPITPIARSLVSCEALFGQLYPAVMIARLVSLELSERGGVRLNGRRERRKARLRTVPTETAPHRDVPATARED